jgi:hypothetical protein
MKTAERLNDLLHHRLGFARLGNVTGRTSDAEAFLVQPVNSLSRTTRIVRKVVQGDGCTTSGEGFDGR